MSETGEAPIEVSIDKSNIKPCIPKVDKEAGADAVTGKIDPRNYFLVGKFQIFAEAIDPDKTHPWTTVRDRGFMAESSFGSIAVGETYDPHLAQTTTENPFCLLLAEKASDGKATSIFVRGLNLVQKAYVMNIINTIAPCLSDVSRHQFIREIIQHAPDLASKNEAVIAEKLARMGFRAST